MNIQWPLNCLTALLVTIPVWAQQLGVPMASKGSPPSFTASAKNEKSIQMQELLQKGKLYSQGFGFQSPLSEKDLKSLKIKIQEIEKSKLNARGGGVDTGGGTIVQTHQGQGLLDLYLYNPQTFASRKMNSANVIETRAFRNLGIDLLRNEQNPLVFQTRAQIEKWRSSSPILTEQLILGLNNLPIYYRRGSLQSSPTEYHLPVEAGINPSQLKMVALFQKDQGVQIGYDDLRALPEKHQIALFIHEALRLINATGNLEFTNKTLQKLTAEIMQDPQSGQSLDRPEYLTGQIALSHLNVLYFFEKSRQVRATICKTNSTPQLPICSIENSSSFEDSFFAVSETFIDVYTGKMGLDGQIHRVLLADLYELVLIGENLRLSLLLARGDYVKSYLQVRSRNFQLDNLIDLENSKGN